MKPGAHGTCAASGEHQRRIAIVKTSLSVNRVNFEGPVL